MKIPRSSAWQKLHEHFGAIHQVHMRDLFREDPHRSDRFSLETENIFLDYSKNRIVDETSRLLVELAREAKIDRSIEGMFIGAELNTTEQRAVLHTALRNRSNQPVLVDNEDVMPKVRSVLERMREFSNRVRSGEWRGYTGRRITDVVNIGIGGSHLGPMMATTALTPFSGQVITPHFVSNVDRSALSRTLNQVNPETTLFIIASKTFTTLETMANAETAKRWFLRHAGDASAVAKHFVATSTNFSEATKFGIDPANIFEFWDWVGGRYSVWSAVGLPLIIALGMDNFEEFLDGAYGMDQHFRDSDPAANIPIILALLGIWYNDFFGAETQAIVPYDQQLEYLPAYLQQLDMESNGKRIDNNGEVVEYHTGPVIWGGTGTDSQHAFFQSLHQGTHLIPIDFIAKLKGGAAPCEHQNILVANCFAQSEALMRGKTEDEVRTEMSDAQATEETINRLSPHRTFPGNKPSNTIIYERLTPKVLGALLAMYEHKVFVQGCIWRVNSFDQWGVELGKKLANAILTDFKSEAIGDHDSSTTQLIQRYKRLK